MIIEIVEKYKISIKNKKYETTILPESKNIERKERGKV